MPIKNWEYIIQVSLVIELKKNLEILKAELAIKGE